VFLCLLGMSIMIATQCNTNSDTLQIGIFKINVTPLIGSPVAYAMTRSIDDSLFAKGLVILSNEPPIVLCAVDWIGIANEGQDAWRQSLAKAAGTTVDRVSVHALHQHDGVRCDFTTADILTEYGLGGWRYDPEFLHKTVKSVAEAVKKAKREAQRVTHPAEGFLEMMEKLK